MIREPGRPATTKSPALAARAKREQDGADWAYAKGLTVSKPPRKAVKSAVL